VTPLRILIVCHANTSRSVMAEAILARLLDENGLQPHVELTSGGVAPFARDGALASLDARLVLRGEGIEIGADTVSTDLKRNRHLVAAADLILAMTEEQIDILAREFPEAAAKPVHTLRAFAGSFGDIDDPVGKDEDVYAACLVEIREALVASLSRIEALVRERG